MPSRLFYKVSGQIAWVEMRDSVKRIGLNTDKERHAAWLELFFDLVYVVALTRLTHIVVAGHGGHIEASDYLAFFTLFVPVWWSWVGHTMYQNRFGTYDITDSLLTLLQMFFAIMLAFGVGNAFAETRVVFALAYAATRWVLIIMYMRVYLGNPDVRSIAGGLSFGFSIGSSLWVISVFFSPPIMYALWITGLAIELVTPLLLRKKLVLVPVHNTHLPERAGLFALLVMGESFLGLVSGADSYAFSEIPVLNLFFGFSIICAIWWLYFGTLEKALNGNLRGAAHLFLYGHLPIYMGIGLLAAGVQRLVSVSHSTNDLSFIFSFSLLLILVPLQFIHHQYISNKENKLFFMRGALVVTSSLIFVCLSGFMSTQVLAFLIIFMLIIYIRLESVFFTKNLKETS